MLASQEGSVKNSRSATTMDRDVTLIEDQGWAEPAASIASTVLSRDAVADDGGGSVYLFTVVIRFLIIRQEEEPGHGMGGLEIALVNVTGQDNGALEKCCTIPTDASSFDRLEKIPPNDKPLIRQISPVLGETKDINFLLRISGLSQAYDPHAATEQAQGNGRVLNNTWGFVQLGRLPVFLMAYQVGFYLLPPAVTEFSSSFKTALRSRGNHLVTQPALMALRPLGRPLVEQLVERHAFEQDYTLAGEEEKCWEESAERVTVRTRLHIGRGRGEMLGRECRKGDSSNKTTHWQGKRRNVGKRVQKG
ncbi:hypothetical protein RRG08_023506 [Elysia crispata]|uniref:Uncharacterized protein n=1 Tax=Elysia crispata TaxID=231223 RepID=A0AAE1D7M8_9GAST|nr:hypothetical protein RRG08_023506 [Elysia crispata]